MKSISTLALFLALFFANFQVGVSQPCLQIFQITDDCDLTANDPFFWKSADWLDPKTGLHDLADAPVRLEITVKDTCGNGTPAPLASRLLLDLDGDGQPETLVDSDVPSAGGSVNFNNFGGGAGLLRQFDFRPVAADFRFRFVLRQQVLANDARRASLMWTDKIAPDPGLDGDWTLPQLPYGNHQIQWFLNGNLLRESQLPLRDCKPPVVECHQNLSANIMPTGMLTIWGIDWLKSGIDNHTPADQLVIAIRKTGTGIGFPLDNAGNPVPGVTFSCDQLGQKLIEVWAKDRQGNTAFCETYVKIQDPFNNCGIDPDPFKPRVCLKTSKGDEISEASIIFKSTHPTLPSLTDTTPLLAGCLYINNSIVPVGSNLTITPVKDDNPTNGVTTYDLLLMQRHILGVTPLDSPYKIIAGDVNKSGALTSNDIVELRKLILGIYTNLPQNDSWRFVLKSHVFPNPLNPFTAPAFPESATLQNVQMSNIIDFIGIKIGDINGNAIANFDASDDRAPHTFLVENQKLRSGEAYILPVGGGGQNALAGFQIGLKIDPAAAQVEQVLPGAAAGFSAENFAASPDGSLAISWFDASENAAATDPTEPLFFLKIKALRDARLSEILKMDDSRLVPEAIETDAAAPRRLDLQFFEKNEALAGFKIFPNPAANLVEVLNLDDVSAATDAPAFFEIFDALGRPVRRGEFAGRQAKLDLQGLPAGQFLLKILSGGEVFTQILIKN